MGSPIQLRPVPGCRPLEHLASLPALRSLNLQNCPLSASSLQPIGRLSGLQSVTLDDCGIGPTALATIASLEKLKLVNSRVGVGGLPPQQRVGQGLFALTALPRLQRLVLRDAGITDADDGALRELTGLRKFELQHLAMTGETFETLASLQSLEQLTLSGILKGGSMWPPRLADAKPLASLPKLQRLQFDCILDSVDEAFFNGWPQLKTLQLNTSGVNPVTMKANLDGFQQFTGLRYISLAGRKIGKEHLARLRGLPSLEVLDVSSTSLSDAHVVDLASLAGLCRIDVRRTQISPQGIAKLQEQRPDLVIISQGDGS